MSELTFRAYEFAVYAHMGQKYGDEPYIHHAVRVADRIGHSDEIGVAVAFLHDVVEVTLKLLLLIVQKKCLKK